MNSPEDYRIGQLERAIAKLLKADNERDILFAKGYARETLKGIRTEQQLHQDYGVIPK